MKRIIQVAAVLAVLAVVVVVTTGSLQSQSTEPATPVPVDESSIIDRTIVTTGDLLTSVSATGAIEPARETPLNFETSMVVAEVLVEEGQRVRAGDVLARLDMGDLERELLRAEIDLTQQRIALEDLTNAPRDVDVALAEAQVAAANAQAGAAYDRAPSANEEQLARLEAEMARNQLWQSQLQRDLQMNISPEFRDSSTQDAGAQEITMNSGLNQAEIGISLAETELNNVLNDGPDTALLGQARASLAEAQVALDNLLNGPEDLDLWQAQASLDLTERALERVRLQVERGTLVAPYDGVIAESNLTVGELPPQSTPAFRLIDTSSLYVDLPVDEEDIVGVQPGQTVQLDMDALPDAELEGSVTRVDVTPTLSGAVVTYLTRVELDATDAPVRPGMTATAEIVLTELRDAVIVPNSFIRRNRETGQDTVTILRDDGQFEDVTVELGASNTEFTQILSGVEPGQNIVLLRRQDNLLEQ